MNTKLKFWGVRGSIASGPSTYGSNTSCVELELGNEHSIFFDAGTGIRAATHDRKFSKISLFLSHFHWDHIQGIPFISALQTPEVKIEIITGFKDARERLLHLFDKRFHPVGLSEYEGSFEWKVVEPREVYSLGPLKYQTAPLNHPGTSYAYRIYTDKNSFIYATDSDYDPVFPEASELFKNANWSIMDSQFLIGDSIAKANYGHASFKQAVDVCASHGVKNCVLYHFDPNYKDAELQNIEAQAIEHCRARYGDKGPKVQMAKEGMSIDLNF